MQQLSSLTIFFPFLNDAGTVQTAIDQAYFYGEKVTTNLEVIAIHGGNSTDNTFQEILSMKKKFPALRVFNYQQNIAGYAVIKHGFLAATKDWVFYTDGDLQYRIEELCTLVKAQLATGADVVNGYKSNRADTQSRKLLGKLYAVWGKLLFNFPIRDLDCDFRLIRRKYLPTYFYASNSSILAELLTGLVKNKAKFIEVSVHHQSRKYGHSNYRPLQLMREKMIGDLFIWFLLRNSCY